MQISSNEIAVIDELGNTVGMLLSKHQNFPISHHGSSVRCAIPCSKQASITTVWLKENFEENLITSVPRSVMFDEYVRFCCENNVKPFNQAVFGKVVRACFPNLATRRLGVRGQSRYHYAGLSVKSKSRYAEKFQYVSEGARLQRTYTQIQDHVHRDVGAHVTIDGTNSKQQHMVLAPSDDVITPSRGSLAMALPPYPNEEDLKINNDWTKSQMASFLAFYRSYNKKLLDYIINLDFENTSSHVKSFWSFVPEDCKEIVETGKLRDVIGVCDEIMFQEATVALLPDCLATLTSEFNVTVRNLAKALPQWIGSSHVTHDVTETRKHAARQWSEHVRRVTTLCHVAKEARRTLNYFTVVSPLLNDLRNIAISKIAQQCAFAGSDDCKKECQVAEFYMKRFCELLQKQVDVEAYTRVLDKMVDLHAGLKLEADMTEPLNGTEGELITDKTQHFIMKWAMYGSKMLTEITLKSSESVGTFHLVMLLFGDYVNHLIMVKNERMKRMKRLKSIIREDSSCFKRLEACSANQNLVSQSSKQQPMPLVLPFAILAGNTDEVQHKNNASITLNVAGVNSSDVSASNQNPDRMKSALNQTLQGRREDYVCEVPSCSNAKPTVVVQPVYKPENRPDSCLIVPANVHITQS